MAKMWVNCEKKTMRFKHEGARITLRGVQPNTEACPIVSAQELSSLIHKGEVCELMKLCSMTEEDSAAPDTIPLEIQTVIHSYSHLFVEPQTLPPHCKFDHHIPLIPGATPINVKPYRYATQQKTEVEKQVKDMLQRGIIQDSNSPFVSPVLLVRKKDGTW